MMFLPHWCRDLPRQMGSLRASEESTVASLHRMEQRKTRRDSGCHHPALPSLRHSSSGMGGGSGFRDQTWSKDWGWLCGDSLRG